jgi:hypothetical protein
VENFRLAARLAFEELTGRLPREHSYEGAKCVIGRGLNWLSRHVATDSRKTSSSLSSFASSFGHDTPVHLQRRFAIRGVRSGDEWAALSAAPNASSVASSAEGVFGAVIARRGSRRDRINSSESGCCRSEALERHSEALHIGRCGGVPCGTSELFRTYASSRVLSTAIKPRPSRNCQIERRAGGVNARRPCGTHGRSGAESVDADEHRIRIHARWASDLRQPGGEDVTSDRR